MTVTPTLPDELFEHLSRVADERGVPADQLVAEWIPSLPKECNATPLAEEDEDLVSCTRAMLEGSAPPAAPDWSDIEEALAETEPEYATVEEAMSHLRSRRWVKDE
jgi:hypothetical protein